LPSACGDRRRPARTGNGAGAASLPHRGGGDRTESAPDAEPARRCSFGADARAHRGDPYYTTETLGGKKYFTAVYPDKAIAKACISCHNGHKDSPRKDLKMGDVMGGVVLRLPVK